MRITANYRFVPVALINNIKRNFEISNHLYYLKRLRF